jgi:hypothetical protein
LLYNRLYNRYTEESGRDGYDAPAVDHSNTSFEELLP